MEYQYFIEYWASIYSPRNAMKKGPDTNIYTSQFPLLLVRIGELKYPQPVIVFSIRGDT